jgi:ATP/maltotriose-dependent transcriptional regulator MalT
MSGGEVAARVEHGERALALALELNERELLGFIYNDLWYAYAGAGRWSQGLAGLAAGRQICRELGNVPALCENLTRAALCHIVMGSYDAALADMDESYQVAQAARSDDFLAQARAFAGLVYLDRGDVAEAIEVGQAAIASGESSSNVTALIGTRSEVARAYLFLGDTDHALALARQAQAVAANHFPMLLPWAQASLVRVHLARGDLAEAEAVQAAIRNYRDLQQQFSFMVPMWANAALANIELAQAKYQFDLAAAEAVELVQRFEDCGIRVLLPEARLRLGEALLAQGRLADARPVLETARQEAEALGSRRLLWPILEALAEAAARGGAPDNARAFQRAAREIVEYIAAQAPGDSLRQSFLATDRVRALLAAPNLEGLIPTQETNI